MPRSEFARLEKQLNALKQQRQELITSISVLHELAQLQASLKEPEPKFIARYAKLNDTFNELQRIQTEIRNLSYQIEEESSYIEESKILVITEDKYYEIIAIGSAFSPVSYSATDQSIPNKQGQIQQCQPHLPKINLPDFDGTLIDWPQFYCTFSSLVHRNQSLSNTDKFHYLLSVLKGPALSIAKSLPLIESNYQIAWQTLVETYENKRILASSYFDQLLNFKPLTVESLAGLRRFLEIFNENVAALKSLKLADLSEFMLLKLGLNILDSNTRRLFEAAHSKDEIPSYQQLLLFIQEQCRILQLSNNQSSKNIGYSYKNKAVQQKPLNSPQHFSPRSFVSTTNKQCTKCPHCHQGHKIYVCPDYKLASPVKRKEMVKNLKLCINCLGTGHMINNCNSKMKCFTCSKRHHTSLHNDTLLKIDSIEEHPNNYASLESRSLTNPVLLEPSTQVLSATLQSQVKFHRQKHTVLLGTASALIQDSSGKFQNIRILIDSGSQSSFILKSLVDQLNLDLSPYRVSVSGLGDLAVHNICGKVKCQLNSHLVSGPVLSTEALVLSHIANRLPTAPLPQTIRSHYSHLQLADPSFDSPGNIQFLLGADLYPQVFTGEQILGRNGYPSAFNSIFGWVLMGKTALTDSNSSLGSFHVSVPPLEKILKQFWEVEEPPKIKQLHPEDMFCEELFKNKHYRTVDGRYVVPLLLKEPLPDLSKSYNVAKNSLLNLERRLSRNSELKKDYSDFLGEYKSLAHMSHVKVPGRYYIPHHCVLKESTSTKLRVVFNASQPTSNGSLNDFLFSGPKLQTDIVEILLHFRLHLVAFTADIQKMYRQILVIPEHRKFQHILWRQQPEDEVRDFELNTVTYGLKCSPYLALRTLQQLVLDEGKRYSVASQVVSKFVYIDNFLCGANSLPDALNLQLELIQLLALGGFPLRKWASNHPSLLKNIPPEHREISLEFSPEEHISSIKLLGLLWVPSEDYFSYSVLLSPVVYTKRSVLSNIARMYDPLGLISPVVFWAKQLMQLLWKDKVEWDDPLPASFSPLWHQFVSELPLLATLRVSRCVMFSDIKECQLIGYSDASQKGYGVSIYLRVQNSQRVMSHLILSKTRVAPLKVLTIPRLELCGALLLAKTLHSVHLILKDRLTINNIFLFTDSTIVLSWLKTEPSRLHTFVSNRVSEISSLFPYEFWSFVSTHHNPSDLASRGILPGQLINCSLWWSGPDWMSLPICEWPLSRPEIITELPELKSSSSQSFTINLSTDNAITNSSEFINFSERFSSLTKLQRIVAYCLRFIRNCRAAKEQKSQGYLSLNELQTSLDLCIQLTQSYYFSADIKNIRSNLACTPTLQRLSPFLDDTGALRVGGRLRYASLKYSAKHPLLLPKKCHITNLIINYFHHLYLHIGPKTLQTVIQQKYWIISARSVIRQCTYRCLTCSKFRLSTPHPFMSDLPPSRVQQGRPFLTVGLDYGGPFVLKESLRRNAGLSKCYLCLFVCFATKAVHLECVSDLTTESFLATLDRFVARRGLPLQIYSDNATNFVGASRQLNALYKFLRSISSNDVFAYEISRRGLQWHHSVPYAPHTNGLAETAIKSAKSYLRKILGDRPLTFEEYTTILSKIEAILNSRPLSSLSTDPNEFECLTPGHFLIGAPLLELPHTHLEELSLNRLSRWQLITQVTQSFWKRWSSEYLHTLQSRGKWTKSLPNLQKDDLVLIKEKNSPPQCWSIGRIEQTHPGKDQVVRVVTLRSKAGIIRRSITQLIPLYSS